MALAEGLLAEAELEALREEALRREVDPLRLLVERGRLSEETLLSLKQAARAGPEEPDATPPPPPGSSPPEQRPDAAGFPGSGWDRYQLVRLLGQGGMGRVFLVYEPRLQRHVALKFVRDEDPELVRRFIAEAQAQARVNHEGVCKVYEAGEVQGHPYIAMQYVDGQPLHELARELSVEQLVVLLARAAEGVHEAHRSGLIHRDLKPSNILVERTRDGRLKPYVMDFGLARDWRKTDTATGTVLGTPHYMAPEQARGEVSGLDRRADVYSLGATLYHLLTGQLPIPGRNALEVLSQIPTLEPRPPRTLRPEVPADLEAIVLKCLEKERSARYDSARALAEDLQRFLDGEPVRARSAGAWYRLRKQLRKHWRAVALTGVALVLVGLALAQAILTRREAAQRERLASHFSAMAEQVEARTRYIALARLHDTRAEHQALRERLEQIEAEMRQGGERALGPGSHALGRGWLALGEAARAREHLEVAWREGFREPGAAYALALALGQLYQEQRLAAEPLRADQRKKRLAELASQYREPVLDRLRQGASAAPSPQYVKALLAFYEDRYDEALAELGEPGARHSWFFELAQLRGDILRSRAARRWDQGQREQAQADLEAARQAYSAAIVTAESAPEVHRALAQAELVALRMELYGQGGVLPHLTRAQEALERAVAVAPDHAASWWLKARLHRRLAEHLTRQGGEVQPPLEQAIASARRAVELAPQRPEPWKELGLAFWQSARARQARSLDPREQLRQALAAFEHLEPKDRDYDFHTNLSLIYKVWADYEDQLGEDSLPNRGKAIEASRAAIAHDESLPESWLGLGTALFKRASHPRAPEPERDMEQARQALEKARAINPQLLEPSFYQGLLHMLRARRLRERGADARPALAEALAAYQQGLAISDKVPQLHNALGLALVEQAREAWDRGEDPFPLLARARAAIEEAIAKNPRQGLSHNNLAEVHAEVAAYQHARGEDPGPSARAAQKALDEAVALAAEHPLPRANRGRVHQLLAAAVLEHGKDPLPELDAAEEALREALQRGSRSEEAWLYLGKSRGLRAVWRARRGKGEAGDFHEAAQAFEKALEVGTRHGEVRLAFGRFCLDWASSRLRAGHDPQPALQRGLELAGELLAARPTWPEARALRAHLRLVRERAHPAGPPEPEQALEELREALSDNPHLRHAFSIGDWGSPGP